MVAVPVNPTCSCCHTQRKQWQQTLQYHYIYTRNYDIDIATPGQFQTNLVHIILADKT